mmetsp:Transcript_111360/g.314983  ORF Transcript_111360/g.314983 Transcript_111360/m.314983 type:complete len:112 (-) Transcript_111360:27-362(-)
MHRLGYLCFLLLALSTSVLGFGGVAKAVKRAAGRAARRAAKKMSGRSAGPSGKATRSGSDQSRKKRPRKPARQTGSDQPAQDSLGGSQSRSASKTGKGSTAKPRRRRTREL